MARKSLVTTTFLKKGQIITKENFTFKRPGTGISPIKFSQIIGKKIKKNIKKKQSFKKKFIYSENFSYYSCKIWIKET